MEKLIKKGKEIADVVKRIKHKKSGNKRYHSFNISMKLEFEKDVDKLCVLSEELISLLDEERSKQ